MQAVLALSGARQAQPWSLPALPRRSARIYRARIALEDGTRRDAYALRYASYLASGHIAPDASRLFADPFDASPGARTIVVYDGTHPVASVRVCCFGKGGAPSPAPGPALASPAAHTYRHEVGALLDAVPSARSGLEGVEVTRLVRSPEVASDQGLVFLLYRLAGYLALRNDFQLVLSCVRQNHVPFYRRLRFSEAGPLKPYPGLACRMQLLAASRADYDAARAAFPIMDPDAFPASCYTGFAEGGSILMPLLPPG